MVWLLALSLGTCARSLRVADSSQSDGPQRVGAGGPESFLQNVVCANHSTGDANTWANYQLTLLKGARGLLGTGPRQFRILVASPVRDTAIAVTNFEDNMKKLNSGFSHDVFHFALFHYDGSNELWAKKPWYSQKDGPVVMTRFDPGCKPKLWSQINSSVTDNYDYIWLLDGDFRFDLFSWDLYRIFLGGLKPLVSQPAILPRSHGERGTLVPILRMAARSQGQFTIAREVYRSEVQAPLISTKLWKAVLARLRDNDLASDHFVDRFWDIGATLSNVECGGTGILLLNGSPLRHMDFHDLRSHGKGRQCRTGCGEGRANCRGVSTEEAELLRDGLAGFCDFIGDSDFFQSCEAGLPCEGNGKPRRLWVESAGGKVSVVESSGGVGPTCEAHAERGGRGGSAVQSDESLGGGGLS